MTDPREVSISIDTRFLTIALPIEDEQLIAAVFLGLAQYVKNGFPIKVRQSYIKLSTTVEVDRKVISSPQQVAEWGKETKGLISALRKR